LHLELLIREVFEKATTQHHFIDMYADLCVVLQQHFAEHSISSDPNINLKKILLNACQTSFEKHLNVPSNISTLEGEEKDAAEQMYKRRMIGNIKLVGALSVRKMLASKILLCIIQELLHVGIPEALESLAALLTVVGATFDRPDSQHSVVFSGIFSQVETLTKDTSVKPRVRCLLRDVLELRAASWQDKKPKKLEGPSTLDEVAEKVYGEGHRDRDRNQSRYDRGYANTHSRSNWGHGWTSHSGSGWEHQSWSSQPVNQEQNGCPTPAPAGRQKMRSSAEVFYPANSTFPIPPAPSRPPGEFRVEEKHEADGTCEKEVGESLQEVRDQQASNQEETNEEENFDKVACNKHIAEAFVGLMTSGDVKQAVATIAALKVPGPLQAEQFCDLLLFIVEAGLPNALRGLGFKLIVAIYLEGCWSTASLQEGLQTFEGLCASDKVQAQDLEVILGTELFAAFVPLFQQGLVQAELLMKIATCKESQASSSSKTDSIKDDRRLPEKRRKKTKKSLIDIAAEQQKLEREQEASWQMGGMVAPSSGYYAPPVMYYAEQQY